MSESIRQYDVVIVGGGLVGMSLAVALAGAPLSILLLEKNQSAPLHDNVLDLRTTGLTRSSEQVFIKAGIWSQLATEATPIERLDISEQGNFGGARIDAQEHGLSPIGYMMPNHHLIEVLSQKVAEQKNLTVLSPASLEAIQSQDEGYQIQIETNGRHENINCALLVGADGSFSKVRELFDIGAEHKAYDQTAIITNVRSQKAHNNIAYERFTSHGPLAVLPIKDNCCALIWTHPKDKVEQHLSLSDEAFLNALQKAFGYRLGKFLEVGKRSAYPLALNVSEHLTVPHAVLIGNAAQTVHPVAAQGFNLGLRDVQSLVEMLARIDYDPQKFPQMLQDYEEKRQPDRKHVIRLTDGLTRVFMPQIWPAKLLRSVGVRMMSNLPILQRSVLRRNLGLRHFLGDTK